MLNVALGVDPEVAVDDSVTTFQDILEMAPTQESLSDATREKDFVMSFIAINESKFVGSSSYNDDHPPTQVYGEFRDRYLWIIGKVLKDACNASGFNSKKVVTDLIAEGFFVPDDKIENGSKTPRHDIKHRIRGANSNPRCYRIPFSVLERED